MDGPGDAAFNEATTELAAAGATGADSEKSFTGSRLVEPGDAAVNEATAEFAAAGATCKFNEGLAGPQGGERPL